jgi:hypothetical protein
MMSDADSVLTSNEMKHTYLSYPDTDRDNRQRGAGMVNLSRRHVRTWRCNIRRCLGGLLFRSLCLLTEVFMGAAEVNGTQRTS